MSILKWLIARPALAIVGALAAIWLLFNYQNIGTVYLLGKYLVLLGVGIYAYPLIEKHVIGWKQQSGIRMIISLLMVFVLLYVLRQVFFLAVLILVLYIMFKGD